MYEYVESIDCFMNKIFLDSIYHSFERKTSLIASMKI